MGDINYRAERISINLQMVRNGINATHPYINIRNIPKSLKYLRIIFKKRVPHNHETPLNNMNNGN